MHSIPALFGQLTPQAASISSLFNLQQTSIKSTKNILRLLFLHGDIYKGMMSYEPSLTLASYQARSSEKYK